MFVPDAAVPRAFICILAFFFSKKNMQFWSSCYINMASTTKKQNKTKNQTQTLVSLYHHHLLFYHCRKPLCHLQILQELPIQQQRREECGGENSSSPFWVVTQSSGCAGKLSALTCWLFTATVFTSVSVVPCMLMHGMQREGSSWKRVL